MQTEQLIARLARQAGPVVVMAPTRTVLARWAVLAVVSIGAGLAWYGIRGDAATRVQSPEFLVRVVLAAAVAAAAARHALALSVPGTELKGLGRINPQAVLAAWTGVLVWPLVGPSLIEQVAAVRWHPQCAWQLSAVAVAPAAWLYWQVRQAAPHDLGWTGVYAGLAAAGTGALAVQWMCGLDGAGHQLVWHVAPLLVMTVVAGLAGRLLLRQH